MSDKKQKPVDKVEIWPIRAAIWRHEGSNGRFYNTTFERVYKDKKADSWERSQSFGRDDLLTLAKVADHAHTKVIRLESADRKERDADPTPD